MKLHKIFFFREAYLKKETKEQNDTAKRNKPIKTERILRLYRFDVRADMGCVIHLKSSLELRDRQ